MHVEAFSVIFSSHFVRVHWGRSTNFCTCTLCVVYKYINNVAFLFIYFFLRFVDCSRILLEKYNIGNLIL